MNAKSTRERRKLGETYTPLAVVDMMCDMVADDSFDVVVDCGCGSGRFAVTCAERFTSARVVAIDLSSAACEMCRANAREAGVADRVEVVQGDFTTYDVDRRPGERVLWIGNPPYVRHHDISADAKARYARETAGLGHKGSTLAGLHAHFVASIARQFSPGDVGCLILSAEWMDVGYGSFMRWLFSSSERLRANELIVFDKETRLFEGTDSTAVIVCFHSDPVDEITVRLARDLDHFEDCSVAASALALSHRWTDVLAGDDNRPSDLVPLGSLMRVHRGFVTGNNGFWIRSGKGAAEVPSALRRPVVRHASDLSDPAKLSNPDAMAQLVMLPANLDDLDGDLRTVADAIVADGKARGVDAGYVASHRTPWWSVLRDDREPPAAFMSYMGRSGPRFVVNEWGYDSVNTVHGLYPVAPMSERAIARLVSWLNDHTSTRGGRTYCGGLVKFEPREAEAILVPSLATLEGRRMRRAG